LVQTYCFWVRGRVGKEKRPGETIDKKVERDFSGRTGHSRIGGKRGQIGEYSQATALKGKECMMNIPLPILL